jgi:hypothetical protein
MCISLADEARRAAIGLDKQLRLSFDNARAKS